MEDDNDFNYIKIICIIYLLNCIILFMINLTFCFIHIREPLLRSNFFIVVFFQIIIEKIICFFLIILNLIILISKENQKWHLFFDLILNLSINTDVFYNIIILIYLTFKSCKKIEDKEEEETNDRLIRNSISFENQSFKFIHITSLILGIIHTTIFVLIIDTDDYTIQSWEKWYYFFYPIKPELETIFIFIPFWILFIMCFPYMFISLKKVKNVNYIHLKHYCINCLLNGFFCSSIPIIKLVTKNINNSDFPTLISSSAFFLLYLNNICMFRYNCIYLDNILSRGGRKFICKIKLFFKLMFFITEVPKPNVIDYNNSFIYHSLAYESDFLEADQRFLTASFASQN